MLEDLLKNSGENEQNLAPEFFGIEKADILTWAPYTVAPAVNADYVSRTGVFVNKTAKKWEKFQIIPGKDGGSDIAGKLEGSPQNVGTSYELEFEVSGIDAAKIGWFKANKNKEMVFAVTDRNGLQRIIGDEIQGAYITSVESTVKGKRGFKVKIVYEGRDAAVYAGTVPLAPGA
jgi:hypothetical protein